MSFIYTYTVIKKYTALLQKIPDNFFKKVIELLRLSFEYYKNVLLKIEMSYTAVYLTAFKKMLKDY